MANRGVEPRVGAERRPKRRRPVLMVAIAAAAWLGAACGGGGSPTGATTPAPPVTTASATAGTSLSSTDLEQIRSNWITFFDGSKPADPKIPLLENGKLFADVLRLQAQGPLAQGSTATVSDISFLAPGRAKVSYSILVDGKPALPNQIGLSVLEDGTWKVADASFCALLTLEGTKTPLCAAPSSGAPPTGSSSP
jgi:hypothetical protein